MALTKEQFQKARSAGFTVEQIVGFEEKRDGNNISQTIDASQQPQDFLPNLSDVEGAIQQRGSQYSGLQNFIKQAKEHPVHTIATFPSLSGPKLILSLLQAGVGTAESALANTGLALQRGQGKDVLQDVADGFKGKRSAQFGDLIRTTGFGGAANEPLAVLTGLLGLAGLSGGASKLGKGEAKIAQKIGGAKESLAGKVINSLIKPSHKEFLFGKNPGLGVAKERIVASSMDDLAAKVSTRITDLDDAAQLIRNSPENIHKVVNLTRIKEPLVRAVKELRKAPKTNAAQVKSFENALSDIGRFGKGNLKDVSISEAYGIKKSISGMQQWTNETRKLDKALRQVYHIVDDTVDNAIPELSQLNSRMANLISAGKAITNRAEILQRAEPANWSALLNLPFVAYRSVLSKTVLGKLLSKGFKVAK